MSLLDLGFYEAFDRPFNPLTDPGYLGSGLDLLQSSSGPGRGVVAAGDLLAVVAGAALCVWSVAAHPSYRPVGAAGLDPVVVGLTVVWAVAGVAGARVGGIPVARRRPPPW